VVPDPFRGIRARRNSAETEQSDHASRSGPEIKDGKRWHAGEAQMRDNPKGVELDPAVDDRRRCKK